MVSKEVTIEEHIEKPWGLKATSVYVILFLLLVTRDWYSFTACHTEFLIHGEEPVEWYPGPSMHLSSPSHAWSTVSAGFIPRIFTPLWCWEKKKKKRIWKKPTWSPSSQKMRKSLVVPFARFWLPRKETFIMESTSEVCRHRRTKQLSRNMLTVLKWFTKFPGG